MAASPSEMTQQRLDPEAIAAVDTSDLLADIVGLPEHLRDAKWKVESAQLSPWDSPGGLIVAGMGGSGVGGLLARAMLGDHASRPILAAREYGLPAWTTPDTTVLCASYSGNTEETLACYEAAGALGARRVVVTSGGRLAELARADGVPVIPVAGGFQPRAAVAYMTVAALEVAGLCGAGPRMGSELDVAADHLEQLVVEWGAEGAEDSESKTLARALADSVPVIAGAGLTQPIAYRWKCQFNENAKIPAFHARAARARPQRDRRLAERGRARALRRDLPRRRRHAPARAGAHRADARARRRAGDRHVRRRLARRSPPSSASSRSSCSATSSRSTSRSCAASTRRPSTSSRSSRTRLASSR